MNRRYLTVDVFTNEAFGGNPLAVVLDSEGLSTIDMQCITREFNYSETTFVLPPHEPANTANIRIFTPGREMPFAGHPNVGTAFVLGQLGSIFGNTIGDSVAFEEIAGLVPIELWRDQNGDVTGAQLTAPQAISIGSAYSTDYIANCVGLSKDDIETTDHGPVNVSAGMLFPVVQLKSVKALERAIPDAAIIAKEPDMLGHIYLYVRGPEDPRQLRARMFAPGVGILEDPATGSAAAALTGLLASLESADGTFQYQITQGVEMGRPSFIRSTAKIRGSEVEEIKVGGQCVAIMQGEINV